MFFRGLADINGDGQMDMNEFSIACKLITNKLKGFELPAVLPPSIMMAPVAAQPQMAHPGGMVAPIMAAPNPMMHQMQQQQLQQQQQQQQMMQMQPGNK